MDNLKLGFRTQFGLGDGKPSMSQRNEIGHDSMIQNQPVAGPVSGARSGRNDGMSTSLRQSNILSTPSDKGNRDADYDEHK